MIFPLALPIISPNSDFFNLGVEKFNLELKILNILAISIGDVNVFTPPKEMKV